MTTTDQPQADSTDTLSRLGVSTLLRRPVRLAGLVIVTVALALLAGWTGLGIGLGVLIIGMSTPAPAAFGVGAASLLVGTTESPLVYVLGAVGLFAVLVDPAVDAPAGRRVIAATAGAGVVIGAGVYGLLTVWSLPAVTAVVAGTVGLIMYALHRYERVMLGLVSDAPDQ